MPFLDIAIPIFNVIENITKHLKGGSSARVDGSLVELLTSSLTAAERGKMEALVQFIRIESAKELATTKSRKKKHYNSMRTVGCVV